MPYYRLRAPAPKVYNSPLNFARHAHAKREKSRHQRGQKRSIKVGAMQEAHCHACQMWCKQENDVLDVVEERRRGMLASSVHMQSSR